MSPIIGLFIALIAGVVASKPRDVIALVIPPMLGATAAQSWYLGTGRGHNPASSTTDSVSYYVVQVLIISAICGLAAAVCWIRVRRGAGRRSLPMGAQRVAFLAAATVASLAATLGAMFVTDRPLHPGLGNGNIPLAGAIAAPLGLIVLVALGVDVMRRSRRDLA